MSCGLVMNPFITEHRREQYEHQQSEGSRYEPDPMPIVPKSDNIVVGNLTSCPEPDQHSDPIGRQGDQPLGSASDILARLGVDVNLACHEEKVVARPVQCNTDQQHERQCPYVAEREQRIA